jgi:hypothetical protein
MNSLFEVHMLNTEGKIKANKIATAFDTLLIQLAVICPEGREFALVKTKLEEAAFFAKKAMAKNPNNQEIER